MEIIEMIWQVPATERIVGIVQWRDTVIVSTDRAVYRVSDDGTSVGELYRPARDALK